MLLFVDTTGHDETRIALLGSEEVWHKFQTRDLSEKLLPEIKNFLKKQKTKLEDLKKIAVVTGPGGFSRTRTGVAVVNALAFGLNIPIVPLELNNVPASTAGGPADLSKLLKSKTQKMVEPYYDRQPNITLSKNK